MNNYELMVAYRPTLKDPEVKSQITALKDKVKSLGGSVVSEDYWGLKDLAYEIKKNTKAIYTILDVELASDKAKELSSFVNADSANVLRNLLTKVNKKAAKNSKK